MGAQAMRDCKTCLDPEGTAKIIRTKKQQKAIVQEYDDILGDLENSMGDSSALNRLRIVDEKVSQKTPEFLKGLHEREGWLAMMERRKQLELRSNQGALLG